MFFYSITGECQSLPEHEDEVTSVVDFCQDFVNTPIPLQTLVRLSGPAIDCPFTGKFTFTYKTPGKKIHNVFNIQISKD